MTSRRVLLAFVMLLLLLSGGTINARGMAQVGVNRILNLTFVPDLHAQAAMVYGTIGQQSGEAQPDGAQWGLPGVQINAAGGKWYVQGGSPAVTLEATPEGGFVLHLHGLKLAAGEQVNLYIPYAMLAWEKITPQPDNLKDADGTPQIPSPVKYRAGAPLTLEVAIPFTLPQQAISLHFIPLLSDLLGGTGSSYRVSGQVTFSGISNTIEFERYCSAAQTGPNDYRAANLRYRLDFPPDNSYFNLLPDQYTKATFVSIATHPVSCEYQTDLQRVTATFNGRAVFAAAVATPAALVPDIAEQQLPVSRGTSEIQYEIHLGEVLLGPGDTLAVSVPGANLIWTRPAPDTLSVNPDGSRSVTYKGPRRFELIVRYSVQAGLLLREIPAMARGAVNRLEGRLAGGTARPSPAWTLAVLGAVLALGAQEFQTRRRLRARIAGWLILAAALGLGVGLFYLLRNALGWMLLAAALYGLAAWPNLRWSALALGMGTAVLLANILDARAEKLFSLLARIDVGLTPLTPAILGVLALAPVLWLLWLAYHPDKQIVWQPRRIWQIWWPWQPKLVFPLILFFFALTTYDAYQKSLSGVVVVALWVIFLAVRYARLPDEQRRRLFSGVPEQIRRVSGERWFLLAFAALTLFSAYQGLSDTISVTAFRPELVSLTGPLILLALQIISIVLTFVASTLLFLLIAPLLPFKAAVLKAALLALALLSIFIFSVGGDQRFISILDQLLVGRFIYYLSAPLLAALVIDLRPAKAVTPDVAAGGGPSPALEVDVKTWLDEVQKYAGLAGGVASLVAPALYASISNYPLLTNYFQLLKLLSQL